MTKRNKIVSNKNSLEALLGEMRPKAEDYFRILNELSLQPVASKAYIPIYGLLQRLCEDYSADFVFSNLFSRLSFVCRQCGMNAAETMRMQSLRRKCHHVELADIDQRSFLIDIQRMSEFVGKVFKCAVPAELSDRLPLDLQVTPAVANKAFYKCLRVQVKRWDDRYIYAEKDEGTADASEIKIDFQAGGYEKDLVYIKDLLSVELPLNLLKVKVNEANVYVPETVIVEPDYLIDVSSLSDCWKDYGHDARNYILFRLEPHKDTSYTLLGQLAGQFLDDLMNQFKEEKEVTYADSVRAAFRTMPVAYAFVNLNEHFDFHEEARRQFRHLKTLISQRLEKDYGFDLSKTLIEPSFVCESLGISGRMDFLQSDFLHLIEQKSGKMDEFRHCHREPHFIQMMLYQAMLEYNVGVTRGRCQSYLLYSKYSEGLLQEEGYLALLRQVLKMRNLIVIQEKVCAEGKVRTLLENISPEDLHEGCDNKLWTDYERPRLHALLKPFKSSIGSDDEANRHGLALDYFYRFYSFLVREHLQAKITSPGNAGRAFSDLWNLPAAMRRELGGLYSNLRVCGLGECEMSQNGVNLVRLGVEGSDDGFLSNFRIGDVVLLYRHDGEIPDVRRQFLMRGRLREINAHSLLVQLNHPQRNKRVFMGGDARFAIEHDMMESSFNRLFTGLYLFLTGLPERQDIVLNRRKPEMSVESSLKGDYGEFNDLVKKERCARDYYLVIGPPGSGKTNQALRYMLEEELQSGDGNILLLAYTNRAVDELCGMLEEVLKERPEYISDYVRIGSELTTEECFRPHLLTQKCKILKDVTAVKTLILSTRLFVGTTTAVSSQSELLQHKHFVVAFVDEASQILEPQLLTLLFARQQRVGKWQSSIERFVFVGDQKQLPAVVQQPRSVSKVKNERLLKMGLSDCRNSLFERLLSLQQQNDETEGCVYLLERQGRMHPDLFQFVNRHFYQDQLQCVPMFHQQRSLKEVYPHGAAASNKLSGILASHRTAFFDCRPQPDGTNDKINSAEATMVVKSLKALQNLYLAENRTLKAEDVGIIVPYRNQIAMIYHKMELLHLDSLRDISIDTVERFQGSQRNVIFFLFTVRHLFQLDFLVASTYEETHDAEFSYQVDRKLNVALTRAREQMYLIGNAPLLEHNGLYLSLIKQYQDEEIFFDSQKL